MPRVKNFPCEIRFYVSEEMNDWLKSVASDRKEFVSTVIRSYLAEAKGRFSDVEISDYLIKEMAKKMGIEVPEKQPDCERKKEVKK